jgi:hypothetical protein
MEIKEKCHTCMDGFTAHNILHCVVIHLSYEDKEEANITAQSTFRVQGCMQSNCFGGLIVGQNCIAR